MNKVVLGLLLGAVLGAIDGLTALFYPEVADQIFSIIVGSTFKGIVAGIIIGLVARKYHNLGLGIVVGLLVGAALAYLVAMMPDENGNHYYVEIIVPGSLVGLILGFATQKFGKLPENVKATT